MLLFLVIYIYAITVKIGTSQKNTGTIFFYNKQIDTDCWSQDDLAKLQARKILNQLIPEKISPDSIGKAYANDALRYYRQALHTVDRLHHSTPKTTLREVLADTFGGHLRSEVLPAFRLAYYAGYVPYKPVRGIHDIYNEIKKTLNTEGQGWKPSPKVPPVANLTVARIVIGRGKLLDPCKFLVFKRDSNACIRMPTPVVDDTKDPTAIALPLKKGGVMNMMSPMSDSIILKYYTTASRCILRRSPASCRHSDIIKFNNQLWGWMKSNVAPHLMDEKLYAAYGGVFRVALAVRNSGKVLPRRNLFENYGNRKTEWGSWQKLTEPYFFFDYDWGPSIYIGIVCLLAFSICLLQLCYNYMLGKKKSCCCREKRTDIHRLQQASNKSVYFNEQSRPFTHFSPDKRDDFKTLQSPKKTEIVYDYSDNLLDVIMSDAEEGGYSSSDAYASKRENDLYENETKAVVRSTSPPKLETSIEQLKINRGRVVIQGDGAETNDKWVSTEDGSSSCCESASSGSSTSRPRRRRTPSRTRDLAWARHVLSSALAPAPRNRSISPRIDMDSFSTSTTQR